MLTNFLADAKGFVLSQCLLTAIRLGIFVFIYENTPTKRELVENCGLAASPVLDIFLDLLIAKGYLTIDDRGYLFVTHLGASFLDVQDSIRSWVAEMQLFYRSLGELPFILQTGSVSQTELSKFWSYKTPNSFDFDTYSEVMDASQGLLSEAILEHLDLTDVESLLDVGGGYGRLGTAIQEKYPDLNILIADLPEVCDEGRNRCDCTYVPLDWFKEEFPALGVDALLFVRVLHDWNNECVKYLLANAKQSLKPQGKIIVIEPMFDDEEPSNLNPTAMMLALFGGKRRSFQEHIRLLEEVGYTPEMHQSIGLSAYRMIVARLK